MRAGEAQPLDQRPGAGVAAGQRGGVRYRRGPRLRRLADKLNIDMSEVGQARIRVFGDWFTVIGILDSKRMKELKDLDDEIMTPADFAVTGVGAPS